MKVKTHIFDPEIMRAYDIRGKYLDNLNDIDSYYLARAISALVTSENLPNTFCIGRDGRVSSPDLHHALMDGLLYSGAEVIDIGVVATPTLYYGAITQNTTVGIMITGSHNPGDQNGFKIIFQGKSFYGERIQKLVSIAKEGAFTNGKGTISFIDIKQEYIDSLNKNAIGTLPKKLKIAWDSGNGATGELVEMLTKSINAEHILLYTKIDGTFPNHHPDPTMPENMHQLITTVKNNNCDLGLAFDGDGDRLGVIDNKGRMIFGDKILLILAKDLLQRHPNSKIVADVKTSDIVFNEIKKFGGQPIIWRTGHSLIKAKMKEEKAMLGGEMSGHLFFGENYYGFDDALFGACKLVNILCNNNISLSDMIDKLPTSYSTPELRLEIDESKKFQFVDTLKAYLDKVNIKYNDLDGVRVQEQIGWWLIRASNTQNALIVRIEGNTHQELLDLSDKVIDILQTLGLNDDTIRKSLNE